MTGGARVGNRYTPQSVPSANTTPHQDSWLCPRMSGSVSMKQLKCSLFSFLIWVGVETGYELII